MVHPLTLLRLQSGVAKGLKGKTTDVNIQKPMTTGIRPDAVGRGGKAEKQRLQDPPKKNEKSKNDPFANMVRLRASCFLLFLIFHNS